MALERVRFLHSSDWQLEQPLGGVTQVPAELHEELLQAPYRAAERVVDRAIREQVDFLVLTGDLLCTETASPYALEFLLRQFERLAEQQVAVYWLGGRLDDPELWPAPLELPENVHRFPVDRLEEFTHLRDGETIAVLVGRSHRPEAEFRAADYAGKGAVPRVALVYGTLSAKALEAKGVSYWALGGRATYERLLEGRTAACYAGSPQGRSPGQTQPHGPVLVELKFGEAELRRLRSDVWSWRHERIELPAGAESSGLEQAIRQRLSELTKDESVQGLLLTWAVVCEGRLARQLREGMEQARLLPALHAQARIDAKWTLAVESAPPVIPAQAWDEDSVCGDFLRAVRELQQQPESWRRLETQLPAEPLREVLLEQLQQLSAEEQGELWQHVAALGMDLLRGDMTLSTASGD